MAESFQHVSVLLDEAVELLVQSPDGFYLDCTFGRGGHSALIMQHLSQAGRLLAIDKDPQAISWARQHFGQEPRFSIEHGSFAELGRFVDQRDMRGQVDGILLDLGVSSPQLDDPQRGFSFQQDGPLDMRMDTSQGLSAAQWLAAADEAEIADVLFTFGEERFARRMAKAIVIARQQKAIETTGELAKIVAAANPAWEKGKHPATRAFQAIRIQVNGELDDLQKCLDSALEVLKVGGRLVVISFHSLEDRIVKRFIRKHVKGDEHLPAGVPVTQDMLHQRLKNIGKMRKASPAEVADNPRARSAVMRTACKIA